jgi:hypothetical protein
VRIVNKRKCQTAGGSQVSPSFPRCHHSPLLNMPRKAPAAADGAEPRRSSRIKDIPKPDPPKKAPAKPRVKKADGEAPKRGKKRAAEDTNGAEPPAKKVRFSAHYWRPSTLAISAIRGTLIGAVPLIFCICRQRRLLNPHRRLLANLRQRLLLSPPPRPRLSLLQGPVRKSRRPKYVGGR